MKPLITTLIESINHILQDHPEITPSIKSIADRAYGNNRENRKYYGLDELDRKLEKWIHHENGYFVELGANDGIAQSNSCYFERHKNWKGILVEPVPHKFLSCKKHRSDQTKFFCNACVSFDYNEKFVEMVYSNLMTTTMELESDIQDPEEHARKGKQFLEPTDINFKFGAIATTLNNILLQSDAPKYIDLLSLDVEGAEIEVLKGVNHKQFRFNYLCIESRDFEKLKAYLAKNNYEFVEKLTVHDYLFKNCEPI